MKRLNRIVIGGRFWSWKVLSHINEIVWRRISRLDAEVKKWN